MFNLSFIAINLYITDTKGGSKMSLDWNHNGKLDASDFLITELLEKELEEKKKQLKDNNKQNDQNHDRQ